MEVKDKKTGIIYTGENFGKTEEDALDRIAVDILVSERSIKKRWIFLPKANKDRNIKQYEKAIKFIIDTRLELI